ncbi:unnamed protein product [Heligmosomoides polygyrus]|uniref:Uncharacterized protein n=1 Tax=Heligmosomoides polygyrus TaxID=6339 RepID=A0A183FWT9_HELPZ|nr:unnamed protein product [Heligmosomoides polygyrus]
MDEEELVSAGYISHLKACSVAGSNLLWQRWLFVSEANHVEKKRGHTPSCEEQSNNPFDETRPRLAKEQKFVASLVGRASEHRLPSGSRRRQSGIWRRGGQKKPSQIVSSLDGPPSADFGTRARDSKNSSGTGAGIA